MIQNDIVSIAIPLYNHEKFIKNCIDSILEQTYQNLEIIIVDNRSTDRSVEIVKNYKDSRIKLIQNKINIGFSANLKKALSQSSGKFTCILCSDDTIHPKKIEKQLNEIKNHDVIFTFTKTINEKGEYITHEIEKIFNKEVQPHNIGNHLFKNGNFLCLSSCMLKTELLKKVSIDPCLLSLPDFQMFIQLYLEGCKFKVINEPLTYYRIWNSNLSSFKKRSIRHECRNIIEHKFVLSEFTKRISSKEMFQKIFNKEIKNENLIPFAVAKEALQIKQTGYRDFAIEIIHNEFQDEKKHALILNEYKFNYTDFIELIETHKMYSFVLSSVQYKLKAFLLRRKTIKWIWKKIKAKNEY